MTVSLELPRVISNRLRRHRKCENFSTKTDAAKILSRFRHQYDILYVAFSRQTYFRILVDTNNIQDGGQWPEMVINLAIFLQILSSFKIQNRITPVEQMPVSNRTAQRFAVRRGLPQIYANISKLFCFLVHEVAVYIFYVRMMCCLFAYNRRIKILCINVFIFINTNI